jgi:tetratricopeptide (TPR) repeat protein
VSGTVSFSTRVCHPVVVNVRVIAIAGVIALAASCTQQHVKNQRRRLGQELPATLEAPTKYEGTVRTAKVRIWADTEYRAQNLRWTRGFGDELDYANQLLEPMLGIRLEAEYKEWDRHAPNSTLRETAAELAAMDPGDDVTWVFGLTSALPLVSSSTDELGVAEVLGTHVVLRGFSDGAERKAFARAFPDLETEEREEVHDARRRHKQTVLLVHELAHTLGALHETDPGWIMHPAYRPEQASISDRNRELMLIALDDRLRPKELREPLATAERLLSAIETADWGGWIAAEKEQLVIELRAELERARAGQTASPVPAAATSQYMRAKKLADEGKHQDALYELEPIIAAYPGNAAIRLLSCTIHLAMSGPKDETALGVCGRAAELAPGDPSPYIAVAAMLATSGDVPGARVQLLHAEERIGNLPNGAPEAWLQVASMYQAIGALTWAEDAAAKSGVADNPILAWASQVRARYGVPRDGKKFKITPENEAEVVASVRGILDLVYAGKLDDAAREARKAEKQWPGAPGVLAARCDLEMRQKKEAAAKKTCRKAIAAYDGAAWAHYLLGILILRGKDTDAGIASLRAATDADPELTQAWRALAKAYQRKKDQAALDELRQSYQARFGRPLPE